MYFFLIRLSIRSVQCILFHYLFVYTPSIVVCILYQRSRQQETPWIFRWCKQNQLMNDVLHFSSSSPTFFIPFSFPFDFSTLKHQRVYQLRTEKFFTCHKFKRYIDFKLWSPIVYFIESRSPSKHNLRLCMYMKKLCISKVCPFGDKSSKK